jgi:Uncharacterized protein conserved in bacteria (DUF2252)
MVCRVHEAPRLKCHSMSFNPLRFALNVLFGIVLVAPSSALAQLRPDQDAIEVAPPELIDRLRADPMAYFRFVNRPWIARVCDAFSEDMRDLAIVGLHGDAHIQQFAVTKDAWGLDDFDDSTRGPALVDMVRFLGSIDLVVRQRGWIRNREALFDRFFAGYRKGLAEPDYRSPQPAIVGRLRRQAPRSHEAFLVWGETLMEPIDETTMKGVVAAVDAVSHFVYSEVPTLSPGYMTVVRAGWLRVGIGSAVTPKILIRIQGPSDKPEDDELVEAKQLRDLGGLRCLEPRPPVEPTRPVIVGTRQIGRLKQTILAGGPDLVIPELVVRERQLREWWMRSWDPSYRELHLDDLRSVKDLAAVVYDSGVQLGAGCLKDETGSGGISARRREMASLAHLERRIRNETSRLVEQLLLGWKDLASR